LSFEEPCGDHVGFWSRCKDPVETLLGFEEPCGDPVETLLSFEEPRVAGGDGAVGAGKRRKGDGKDQRGRLVKKPWFKVLHMPKRLERELQSIP
jgi:hypothetical protein